MAGFFISALFVISSLLQGSSATSPSSVRQAFYQADIVPDVLSSFNPIAVLDVVFTDPVTHQAVDVTPGATLTRTQTTNQPDLYFEWPFIPLLSQFVAVMVDPDAPFPQTPVIAQVRHLVGGSYHIGVPWLGRTILKTTTAPITEWERPTPPQGSSPHRYVILVYNQPPNFAAAAAALISPSTPRISWNLATFAAVVGLGNPVAGNFFYTGPDETSLPIPH